MKAVLYAGDGQVSVETVADPGIEAPTDAVVRVRRSAVCGTDLHLVAHADQVPRGSVLGHEFVGEVVAVGAAVLADGSYGIRDVYVGLPVRLGRHGLREIVQLNLQPDELVALRAAADRIRDRVGALAS